MVAAALKYLVEEHRFSRDEIFVSSKGGVLEEDADFGITANMRINELLKSGIIDIGDIYQQSCLEPAFLKQQITKSKQNLGVQKIDCYSLNLPEIWLAKLNKNDFYGKLLVNLLESL